MPNDNLSGIYVRVSTMKDSQKDSPEHQKAICEEKLRELNLDVLYPHYEDRDTGTSIMAREEIQRLVSDAKNGMFKTVIFAALSRFSRDMVDALTLKRTLVDMLGVRLISIDENYDSKIDTDEFKFQIISAVNQKLSGDISLSSRRGIRESAKAGNFTGSKAPYGYMKKTIGDKKTIVPNPDTADTLKRIFSMYISGMGDKAIVNTLNEELIPSYTGKKWGVSSVKSILQNPVYSGKNYFGKYKTKKVYNDINDISNRRNKLFATKREKWEVTTLGNETAIVTHEPLVDEETFQLALEIRNKRNGGITRRGGSRAKINVFAGLLYCEHCGSPINTVSSVVNLKSGTSQEYRYLVCSTRRRTGVHGCENSIKLRYDEFREKIISSISSELQKLIKSDDFQSKYKDIIKSEKSKGTNKEIEKCEKIIEDSRKLLLGIRKMKLLGEIDDKQYEFEKSHYEEEIRTNQSKLNSMKSEQNKIVEIENIYTMIKKSLEKLAQLNDYQNVEETNFILKQLVYKIILNVNAQVKVQTPLGTI